MHCKFTVFAIITTFGICVIFLLCKNDCNNNSYQSRFENSFLTLSYVESVLELTRWRVKLEMKNYNYSDSRVNRLEDLLVEHGGTPIRSLIVSTWRSGSTFLGDLLNAMPSNFYSYEPLTPNDNKQIKTHRRVLEARDTINKIFKCNFNDVKDYTKYLKKNKYYTRNTRLFDHCKYDKEICTDANFTSKFCKLFPFRSMKLVKLRLCYVQSILDDKQLNVKIVLLIRDPRGVMLSRLKGFCREPDCANPKSLCSDMISDYYTAKTLLEKYPDRLMTLRFEDLVLNLNTTTLRLLKFLKLSPNKYIDEFLSSHTNANDPTGNPFSTYRMSRKVAFKWMRLLDFDRIADIQDACKDAMKQWGYQLADNTSHMDSGNFFPLKRYYIL